MAFSTLEYLSELAARLAKLSKNKRTAFALWCCFELWRRFSNSLRVSIGSAKTNDLAELLDSLWSYSSAGQMPLAETVDKGRRAYDEVASSDVELNAGSELETFGVIELLGSLRKCLEVFEDGSTAAAAGCAEHLINWRDHELAFVREENDPLSHPEMLEEIERQHRMIIHLSENDVITKDDKTRYRL